MSTPGSDERERVHREKDLAFFGVITASVSHELNNVISIVYQTAGLLDDLLIGAQRGRPIPDERLEQIARRIGDQTERGAEIIKRLNTFAHSVDLPNTKFEVNGVIENLIALAQRPASMKRVDLVTELSPQPVPLTGSPFGLQQVLFATIRQLLTQAQEADTITVSSDRNDGGAVITIEGRSPDEDGSFDLSEIEFLMSCMGGTLRTHSENGHTTLGLLFPSGGSTPSRPEAV